MRFIPLEDGWHSLRVLAGMLLVVQGFETSRYLSAEYEADIRIRSMRAAQILSAGIYLIFITLMLPLLQHPTSGLDETALIRLSAQAAYVLPFLLLIAAAMSQFSAAVADVLGAGGLFSEFVGRGNAPRGAYALITGVSISIVWTTNIFEIISLASRAFALYYLLQTLLALSVTRYIEARSLRIRYALGFGSLGLVLAMVVLFAVPAD